MPKNTCVVTFTAKYHGLVYLLCAHSFYILQK